MAQALKNAAVPDDVRDYINLMIAYQTDPKRGQQVRDLRTMEHVLAGLCVENNEPSYSFHDLEINLRSARRLMTFAAALKLEPAEFKKLFDMTKDSFMFPEENPPFQQYKKIKDAGDEIARRFLITGETLHDLHNNKKDTKPFTYR